MKLGGGADRLVTFHSQMAVIAAALLLWEILAGGLGFDVQVIDPIFFSRPSRIAVDLYQGIRDGEFTADVAFTLEASVWGLVLGMVSGIFVGFLFAYLPLLHRMFEPLMIGFNSLPRPALGPVVVLIFGLGILSKIVLSWSIVFFVVFYN